MPNVKLSLSPLIWYLLLSSHILVESVPEDVPACWPSKYANSLHTWHKALGVPQGSVLGPIQNWLSLCSFHRWTTDFWMYVCWKDIFWPQEMQVQCTVTIEKGREFENFFKVSRNPTDQKQTEGNPRDRFLLARHTQWNLEQQGFRSRVAEDHFSWHGLAFSRETSERAI